MPARQGALSGITATTTTYLKERRSVEAQIAPFRSLSTARGQLDSNRHVPDGRYVLEGGAATLTAGPNGVGATLIDGPATRGAVGSEEGAAEVTLAPAA